jgi:formate dehydrogenase
MPNNGMVPHYSGDTLSAQQRIAAMTKDILDRWFNNQQQEKDNIILEAGNLVSPSYTLSTTKCPMEHKQVEAGVRA